MIDTIAGQEGTGAGIVSISEVRDALLDSQIQSETSDTSNYSAQQTALQNAEAYLGEQITSDSGSSTSSSSGLAAMLSNLFSSFSSMTTGSGDPATVVQSAQEVANQFNQVSASLSQVQSNLNSSIQTDVNTVNQDISQIATLNQQIMVAQAGGDTADDLVDTREQTIENLAGLMNITTSSPTEWQHQRRLRNR